MESALAARLELALTAAREAGDITLKYFRQGNYEVEVKSDASPVTQADRESEQHLRSRIAEVFADDAVLGEEFGETAGSSGYRWILDPIDGTKSFIHGVPLYGTLVGVEHAGESKIGVIHAAAAGETVYAAQGGGAWYVSGNGTPQAAQVSATANLAEGLLLSSEVEGFTATGKFDIFAQLSHAAKITRTWGDCYGYLLVVTGRADAMIDPRMHLWDAAALQPILIEAGGTFTDWEGQPTIYSGNGIATNGKVLDEVLAITRQGG